jgi:hypothetical protein
MLNTIEGSRNRISDVKKICNHYWLIECATGHQSFGICKYCGEKRHFNNSIDEEDLKAKAKYNGK